MSTEVTNVAEKINEHHKAIIGFAAGAVGHAIAIGELLHEQKHSLRHGEWQQWVKDNLTFGEDQAARHRHRLRS